MNTVGARRGHVSVLIVNYRGADDTLACIEALQALDWPADRIQVVVVDNASGDGSAARIAAAAPHVALIESAENLGFAGGCNLAAASADGEFLALINNDARPHRDWLREAVAVLEAEPAVGAVASKVLNWDGTRIDFAGGNINAVGQGYRPAAGLIDDGSYDRSHNVLFFTGSGAIVRSRVFAELDGFDDMFFMFFEDVDFGWRANLRGYQVRYAPASVVYHKHHASIGQFADYREKYLLARNSLLTIYKNFGAEALQKVLAPTLMLAVHDAVLSADDDPDVLDLQHNADDGQSTLAVDKRGLIGPYAIDFLVRNLAAVGAKREVVQSTRLRTDETMVPLFGDLLLRTSPNKAYATAWDAVIEAFDLKALLPRPLRVLVVTADTLAPRMAGPAIRAVNIATALSAEHEVRLVSTTQCALDSPLFQCIYADDVVLRGLVEWTDVIIFQGFVMHEAPWMARADKVIVVDIYDPIHLEQLEQTRSDEPVNRRLSIAATTAVLNRDLSRGDFFLCASEEQRHFWLGQLAAVGRLNPANYDRDSSLRNLLDVAPFGLDSVAPTQTRSAIKGGDFPTVDADDQVIIWGGGVYNWFDPLTLISAVGQLAEKRPNIRLFFLGMKHPNPNVPAMHMAWEARQLSDRLGLTDSFILFNEQWVDYADRANYLLDADVGTSAHFLHVETTFSFRTRMLDYLWAGLPIVATDGDSFGRLIKAEGLGVAVPERDVDAMAEGLDRVLFDDDFREECRANVARVREEFTWERTLAPLVEFCRTPLRAEDYAGDRQVFDRYSEDPAPELGRVARNVGYARHYYAEGGPGLLAKAAAGKVRRRLVGH